MTGMMVTKNKLRSLLWRICFVWVAGLSAGQAAETPQLWAETHMDELLSFYRGFHLQPELSFREVNTAARLAAALQECGVDVTTAVGGHGVVGLLKNGDGPVVMLRADLDALPVTEQTGLAFSSTVQVGNEDINLVLTGPRQNKMGQADTTRFGVPVTGK